MNGRPHQPHTRPLSETLGAHAVLGRLLQRLRESQARFDLIKTVLTPAMRPHVSPGVLDDEGWNLLVPNSAVAAKLRHSLPLIEQVLREASWPKVTVRVKVRGQSR